MTVDWENTAKLVFEKDLDTIQTISRFIISVSYDPMESVIIEKLEKEGVSIKNSSLFLGLAIWEYNTFVNYHLYWRVSIWSTYLYVFWNEYRALLKKYINDFCDENEIPWEVFQAVESIYHWKSTRELATNYSAPFSVIFEVNKNADNPNNGQTISTQKEHGIRNKTNKDTKCEKDSMVEIVFDNYWDACVPIKSNLYSIGLFQKKAIDVDNALINKEFIDEIEQVALCPNYVKIIENNLRRNLVEVFFYSIQDNKGIGKLLFEALEEFIPNTFYHRMEVIIAPLVAILDFYLNNKECLYPMQFVKYEFSPILSNVYDDLLYVNNSVKIKIDGNYSSLIEQWGKWRGIEVPPEDECNLIFALVCGLQSGRESLFEYYYKKLSNQKCQSFLESVMELYHICSSLDDKTINSYLDNRAIDYGWEGYRNEEGLLHVSGPARNINTMICDLDIPTATQPLTDQIEESVQQEPQPEQLSPVDCNQVIPDSLTTEHRDIIKEFEIGKKFFTHKKRNYALSHCTILNEGFNLLTDEDKANRFNRLIQLLARERCIYPSTEVMRSCAYAMTGYGFNNPFKPVPVFWNREKVDILLYICQKFYNKRGNAKTPMSQFKTPAEVFHVIKEYQEASNRSQSASKVDTGDFGEDFKEIFPKL